MSKTKEPPIATVTIAEVRLTWHDTTCVEGEQCRNRSLHALAYEAIVAEIVDTLRRLNIEVV